MDEERQTICRIKPWIAAIYIAFLVMHLGVTSQRAVHWKFPNTTDENEHLSLAYHLKEKPAIFLKYEDHKILAAPDYREWDEKGNHLVHQSLYYLVLGLFLPGDEAERPAVLTARMTNVLLSTLALMVIFWAGLPHLSHPRQHIIFAVTVTMSPMIGGLGGQVHNGNMALLAGAVVLAGLSGLVRKGPSPPVAWVCALGFIMGSWTKLTAGLLLGAWISLVHILIIFQGVGKKPDKIYWCILALAFSAGISPFVYNLFEYGAVLYNTDHFPSSNEVLGFRKGTILLEYLWWFFYTLAASWVTDQPGDGLQIATLVFVLVLSIMGAWRGPASYPRGPRTGTAILAVGAIGAAAAVILINLAFTYVVYFQNGYLSFGMFRHYLPVWAGVMLGVTAFTASPTSVRIQRVLLPLLILLFSYSAIFSPAFR